MRKARAIILLLLCASVSGFSGACKAEADPEVSNRPVAAQTSSAQLDNDPLRNGILDHGSEGLRKAWRRFTSGGRYRVAGPADFKFPVDASGSPIESLKVRTQQPYMFVGWDINRDGDDGDFAVMVVDMLSANRMGAVIFSGTSRGRYKPFWIQSDFDPALSLFAGASHRLSLETIVDGVRRACEVKWDDGQGSYNCR